MSGLISTDEPNRELVSSAIPFAASLSEIISPVAGVDMPKAVPTFLLLGVTSCVALACRLALSWPVWLDAVAPVLVDSAILFEIRVCVTAGRSSQ